MAVIFTLKGRDLEIVCTVGETPNLPVLSYRQGTVAKCFRPRQIEIEETTLGKLVTVRMDEIGEGETTFAIFLPALDTPPQDSVGFTTIGMYKELRGPSITPGRPVTGWRSVQLYGIARTAQPPLTHAAPN